MNCKKIDSVNRNKSKIFISKSKVKIFEISVIIEENFEKNSPCQVFQG